MITSLSTLEEVIGLIDPNSNYEGLLTQWRGEYFKEQSRLLQLDLIKLCRNSQNNLQLD